MFMFLVLVSAYFVTSATLTCKINININLQQYKTWKAKNLVLHSINLYIYVAYNFFQKVKSL
jgi:hypothetical protein